MRRFKNLFFAIGILLIASFALAADDEAPSIKTTISKKRIFIGDRIRYRTEILSGTDLDIDFPKFKENKIGDCEIKDSGKSVKGSLFGRRTYTNWLDITSYMVGAKRAIPSIEIKYREKGEGEGAWKALKTPEFTIKVETVLPRTKLTDIKDIKGPFYPFSFLRLFFWIIGALAILRLIYILAKKLRKKAPPKLPHEIALGEIESARGAFASSGDTKEYYVRVSDAVRRYIESVFLLRAPEMTTQEFLMSLNTSPKLSPGHKGLLKDFMEACDLVKFAKHAPARVETGSVFDTAKKFIEETKDKYPPSQSTRNKQDVSARLQTERDA